MMIDTMCCYTEKETKLVKIHTHLSDEKANPKKICPFEKKARASIPASTKQKNPKKKTIFTKQQKRIWKIKEAKQKQKYPYIIFMLLYRERKKETK